MLEIPPLLILPGGIALLIFGAEVLVRSSSSLGLRLGMHPVTIGAVIVGFGTSAPELVVSWLASYRGEPGIALGNVVGSNVANLGLVLGVAVLLRPLLVDSRIPRFEYPFAFAATAALLYVSVDGVVARWEGALLIAFLCVFLLVYIMRSRTGGPEELPEMEIRFKSPTLLLFSAMGLGMLIFGSDLVVTGAKKLALEWGMSETAVSSTIVAVGTSLPELATAVMAAIRGAHGIVLGNVLGSNIFNCSLVMGTAAATNELQVDELTRVRLIPLMMVLTLLLFPILRSDRRIRRFEGLVLLGGYILFLYFLAPK